MRTPMSMGDLLPVAVPGFLVIGALSILVTPTFLGALAFTGPLVGLLLGLATGVLVFGYLITAVQTMLSGRAGGWGLPPETHLAKAQPVVTLPAEALERAGFSVHAPVLEVPLGHAFSLERALAGAWGTPEGAGWDRVAFVQRMAIAFWTSAGLALLFLLGAGLTGQLSRGLRDHATPVLVLGLAVAWLLSRLAARLRKEAVLELFADARALLLDRGENREVQRVLADLDVRLAEEELGIEL